MSDGFDEFLGRIASAETEQDASAIKAEAETLGSRHWSNNELVAVVVACVHKPQKHLIELATEIVRRFIEWKNQDAEPGAIVTALMEEGQTWASKECAFLGDFTHLGEVLADKVKGMPCAKSAGERVIQFLAAAFERYQPYFGACLGEMHILSEEYWPHSQVAERKSFLTGLGTFLRGTEMGDAAWRDAPAQLSLLPPLLNSAFAFYLPHKPEDPANEWLVKESWELYKWLEQQEPELAETNELSVFGHAFKVITEAFLVEHSGNEAGCRALEQWVGKAVEWAVMEVPEGHRGLEKIQDASMLFIANVLLYIPKFLEKDLDGIIRFYIQNNGQAFLASGITSAYTKEVGKETIEKHTRDFVGVLPELEPEPQLSFFNILELISRTKPLLFEREVEKLEPYLSDEAVCNQTVLILKRLAEVNNKIFEGRGGDYVFRLSDNIPNPKTKMDLVSIYPLIARLGPDERERAVAVMDKSLRDETESSHKALYLHFWKEMVQEDPAPFVHRKPLLLELRKDPELTSRADEILKHLPSEEKKEPPPSPDPPERQPRPDKVALYEQPKQMTPRPAEPQKSKPPPRDPDKPLSKEENLERARTCTLFMSYHPRHRKEVKSLMRLLELHDMPCWMHPGPLEDGEYMKEGVDLALANSKCILLCIDRRYAKSPVCTAEIERAMEMDKQKTAIPLQFESMEWPPKGPQQHILQKFNTVPFYLSTNEKPYRSHPWPKRGEDALFLLLKHLELYEPRPDPPEIVESEDDGEEDSYRDVDSSDEDSETRQLKESISLPPIGRGSRSPSASSRRSSAHRAEGEREDELASLSGSLNNGSRQGRVIHSGSVASRPVYGGGGPGVRPSLFDPSVGGFRGATPAQHFQNLDGAKLPSVYRQGNS